MSLSIPLNRNNYQYQFKKRTTNPLNRNLTIVFCLPGNNFSNNFLMSWSNLLIYCFTHDIKPIISCKQCSNVYHVRSMCLGGNLMNGPKQKPFNGYDYDFIMWIDSDQVFSVDHFITLLKHNEQVVSGGYLMHNSDKYAIVKEWNESHFIENGCFEFLNKKTLNEWLSKNYSGTPRKKDNYTDYTNCNFPLIKISYAGMGWMLIKKGVIEQIEYPWFESTTFNFKKIVNGKEQIIKEFVSEDVAFCKKLEKLNIPIYFDVKAIVGHEKTTILY